MRLLFLLALFGLTALITPRAHALSVVEPDIGELSTDFFVSTALGPLGLGFNQVQGRLFDTLDPIDHFDVDVLAGHQITSVEWVIFNHVDSPAGPTAVNFAVFPGAGGAAIAADSLDDNGTKPLPLGGALGPGNYSFRLSFNGQTLEAESDWKVKITTAERPFGVPSPAAAVAGLPLLLGLTVRRRPSRG